MYLFISGRFGSLTEEPRRAHEDGVDDDGDEYGVVDELEDVLGVWLCVFGIQTQ